MRVLVTGSAGFVGRHMVAALEARHVEVIGVDLQRGEDVRGFFRADASSEAGRWDLVIHCAAVVGGRTFIDGHPLQLASEDLSIDAELFRWALKARPGRIVYYSSSAAYPVRYQERGTGVKLLESYINLDDVCSPDAMYGWVKLTGEQLARHAQNEGIPVTVLRPFSGYGTDQALDYPFPAIIDRVKRREDPLIVWGDGLQTRDWVHISDIVGMTMAAIEADVTGPLNIGTGIPTSFLEFAQTAADIAGYNPVIEGRRDKPVGVDWRVADTSRSHPFYVPKIQLEEGIRMALEDRDG